MQDDRKLLRHSHAGLAFVLTLGLSSYLGLKADERLGTSPLFTFLGAVLGFSAATYQLYVGVYGAPGGRRGRGGAGPGDRQGPPDRGDPPGR